MGRVEPGPLMPDMAVAAGSLFVSGCEVAEESRVGVGRRVDRLAKDYLLVGTAEKEQGREATTSDPTERDP